MPGRRPLQRTPRAGSVTPHRPARLGAAWIFALALLALLSGCSAKAPNLLVRAPKDVNGGKPVYMLVRAVEEASFGVDSYRSVAARVSAPDGASASRWSRTAAAPSLGEQSIHRCKGSHTTRDASTS